ncbi:MAG: AAA domain-containing protein [Candidatus Lokiarchaeota archaeon]|nr:AAA domain-containing protein [Candidatus Lokiarchaeota archaeon]
MASSKGKQPVKLSSGIHAGAGIPIAEPAKPILTTEFGTKVVMHNVIFPSGDEQDYFPMQEYRSGEHVYSEVEVIQRALKRDAGDDTRRVTTVYFMSPPGLGKTVLGAWLAREHGCPYQVINCVSSMTDLDLLGSHVLVGQETIWQDGPLPSIIRATNEHGMGILIINELNALTTNAQLGLNPLLDKQQCVILTQNNNERVQVQSGAHLLILASMNPDIMGVNELQDAVRDRSNIVLFFDYPSVEKEADLVHMLTGLDTAIAARFASVINECRLLKTRDRQITQAPSTRGLLDWINYAPVLGTEIAFELAVVNRYGTTEDERNALKMIARGKHIADLVVTSASFKEV